MRRSELEHIIRAASEITNEYELVIVGSQSILGAFPNAPDELLGSMEADVYPLNKPELADLIDGAIGEDSPFHDHFKYYAEGIHPDIPALPAGWKNRLVKVQNRNTNLKIGYCLDPRDLAASKLIAGREKDWEFVRVMLEHKLVDLDEVRGMIDSIDANPAKKSKAKIWLNNFHARNALNGPSGP